MTIKKTELSKVFMDMEIRPRSGIRPQGVTLR